MSSRANGVKVYVDGQSIALLQGSSIDYVDTLMGAGFTVNNPNAVSRLWLWQQLPHRGRRRSGPLLRPLTVCESTVPRRGRRATGGFVIHKSPMTNLEAPCERRTRIADQFMTGKHISRVSPMA